MEELATLLNYSSCDPATRLPQMRSDFYWSSSTYTSYPYYAWYVHFGNGNVFGKAKTYDYYVRLVRGERRAVTGKTTA